MILLSHNISRILNVVLALFQHPLLLALISSTVDAEFGTVLFKLDTQKELG